MQGVFEEFIAFCSMSSFRSTPNLTLMVGSATPYLPTLLTGRRVGGQSSPNSSMNGRTSVNGEGRGENLRLTKGKTESVRKSEIESSELGVSE